MKITLIYPAVGKKESKRYIKSWKMEPLPLMTLAALTPLEHEITFFDDRLEKIDFDHPSDLVGINIEAYSALRAYNIAKEYRKRKIPVIFGGYHATLMPEEVIEYGDAVVIGEADGVWEEVLNDVKNKSLKKYYQARDEVPFGNVIPRRDIIKGKKYTPIKLVETSRGCNRNCNFCSITKYYDQKFKTRTIESVIKEIRSLNSKIIFFIDDNIVCNKEHAKELFKALIQLKIMWVSQFSIDMAGDDELLNLMVKSGCKGVLIGFESLNHENLKLMGKAWNDKYRFESIMKKFNNLGLGLYATFVFGYDNDTFQSFEDTLNFAINEKMFFAAFNHLQPFPGTPYYNELSESGRLIFKKWWLDTSYKYGQIVFKPKNFTSQELENKCIEARSRFYSIPSILKRGFSFKTNSSSILMALTFFIQNWLARREVRDKWGLNLGKNLDTDYK